MSNENERCGICIARDSCVWKTTMNSWCTKYQSRHEVTTETDSVEKTCGNCNSGGVGLTCRYCTGRNAWQPVSQPEGDSKIYEVNMAEKKDMCVWDMEPHRRLGTICRTDCDHLERVKKPGWHFCPYCGRKIEMKE
jgi:hypothetical protein